MRREVANAAALHKTNATTNRNSRFSKSKGNTCHFMLHIAVFYLLPVELFAGGEEIIEPLDT